MQFAFIYLFNIIIGIGPFFLPKAFSQAGLLLGTLLLIILAVMNYVTATFVVEAMAIANAYSRYESREKEEPHTMDSPSTSQSRDDSELHKVCLVS